MPTRSTYLTEKKIHQDIASLEQKMNFSPMEKMFQMTLRASGQLTHAIYLHSVPD